MGAFFFFLGGGGGLKRGKIRGQWGVREEMLDLTPLKLPPILHLFETFFEAVNLCNLTTRVSGELTKNHHISPLKYVFLPLKIANLTKIQRLCFTETRVNLM